MGGKVLELESEKLIKEGIKEGTQVTIEETVNCMRKSGKFTEEDIGLATGLDLKMLRKIKQEKYMGRLLMLRNLLWNIR